MDFCEITKQLWRAYLSNKEEENNEIFKWIDKEGVIIGTGAHEYYVNLETFSKAWIEETKEREKEAIVLNTKNFWCEQKQLSPDVCLVYGGIYIFWNSEDKSVSIDMDSRFSFLYQKKGNEWKVVHIHQSLPNIEQMDGEYFPRTLHNQIEKVKELAAHMTNLALKDGLTNLINYRGLEEIWKTWKKEDSWLFVIDLDDFKQVNDTHGHILGNEVLKKVAEILVRTIRSEDAACRLGGDEFVVLCSGLHNEEEAHRVAKRIVQEIRKGGEEFPCWIGISMGGICVQPNKTLEENIENADKGLYYVKKTTKDGYILH